MNARRIIYQQGFTLVEIMIGMALGGLMLLGIFKVFDANFSAYRLLISDSDIQESTRLARTVMLKDIRNAGNLGCRRDGQTYTHNELIKGEGHPGFDLLSLKGFRLNNKVNSNQSISTLSSLHTDAESRIVETGTDVLGLVTATAISEQLVAVSPTEVEGNEVTTVTLKGNAFKQNDYIMIANCSGQVITEVFKITAVSAADGNQVLTLNTPLAQPTASFFKDNKQTMSVVIYKLEAISYFISTGLGSTDTDKRYSLFRKVNNNTAIEYIAGIDDLQIDYETDNGKRAYIKGDDTTGQNESIANIIHVNLVIRSDTVRTSQVFTGPDYGKIGSDNNYPDDGKLRRLVRFSGKIRGRH